MGDQGPEGPVGSKVGLVNICDSFFFLDFASCDELLTNDKKKNPKQTLTCLLHRETEDPLGHLDPRETLRLDFQEPKWFFFIIIIAASFPVL